MLDVQTEKRRFDKLNGSLQMVFRKLTEDGVGDLSSVVDLEACMCIATTSLYMFWTFNTTYCDNVPSEA